MITPYHFWAGTGACPYNNNTHPGPLGRDNKHESRIRRLKRVTQYFQIIFHPAPLGRDKKT
ncbi:MAG: hypothetical protein D3910_12035 [Candidatus Electrothrix sp. ATG2]|nr:hypothetical protein [Candidatus Electrothrix sp. ATG2]